MLSRVPNRDASRDISYVVTKNNSGYRVVFLDMTGNIIDSIDNIEDHITLENRIAFWVAWYVGLHSGHEGGVLVQKVRVI